MAFAQILDCTLRDGGYLVDKTFGEDNIKGIIDGLVKTGVDIIEIGFLQNEGFGEGKTVFLNSKEAQKVIPKEQGNSIFTAFADYSRYDVNNLDDYTGESFQAVRECFFKKERYDAMEYCRIIKEKGYLLFVQPVDILGYSDAELLELIQLVNAVEPYCFSIVDTFGSMYEDDLHHVFSLIDHNLNPNCKIGFHSHNNLQMSSALSQAFLRFANGKREVVVDTTISGMGRGAGNTPTELIVQYMVEKLKYTYNLDSLLDVIDNYMRNIRSRAEWGYNTQMFLAGTYSAHVNNLSYLLKKNSIQSKDIRYILNEIGAEERKRYNYPLLDEVYMNYMESEVDDSEEIARLHDELAGKNVVILAAGKSLREEKEKIKDYIEQKNAIVISINHFYEEYNCDYIYFSNVKRYQTWCKNRKENIKQILTSNIKTLPAEKEYVVSFKRLIKCGWENMDNSTILLLRLLDLLDVASVGIAGFDGYSLSNNYANNQMEYRISVDEAIAINQELTEMMQDFEQTKKSDMVVQFITESKMQKGVQ